MNKISKTIAKERSFVLKLTKKDIVELLKILGDYTLNENIFSEDTGKKLSPIEKFFDEENGQYKIMLRCKKNDKTVEVLRSKLTSVLPILNGSHFNPNETIILLSDFSITELSINSFAQENKQLTYAKYMYERFGEYYREKYNRFVRKSLKTTSQDTIKE